MMRRNAKSLMSRKALPPVSRARIAQFKTGTGWGGKPMGAKIESELFKKFQPLYGPVNSARLINRMSSLEMFDAPEKVANRTIGEIESAGGVKKFLQQQAREQRELSKRMTRKGSLL